MSYWYESKHGLYGPPYNHKFLNISEYNHKFLNISAASLQRFLNIELFTDPTIVLHVVLFRDKE